MKLKIAICDDDSDFSGYLSGIVSEWARTRMNTCEIKTYPSGDAFLFGYSGETDYDILLFDIEMPGTDGVTVARKVRGRSETAQIIFITGYTDYIAEGYDVSALHYLVKPVNEEKLLSVLDRAVVKLQKNEKTLTLKLHDEIVRIMLYEIKYIEVFGNTVTVHAKSDINVRQSLSEIEKGLDERFFRIGRSCIVNLKYVDRVRRTSATLRDGTEIPLPRGAYDALNRELIKLD